MKLLGEWLKGQTVPLEEKVRFYECLKDPGICIPKHSSGEVCQMVKNILTNKSRRTEGLIMLDLILDKIPNNILEEHIVFYMKQTLTLCANEALSELCFRVLHRLIRQLESMIYVERDVKHEVFPQLIQIITRELAKTPVSATLLALTRVTVMYFGKMCATNREAMEKFLYKQVIHAEHLNKEQSSGIASTLATLAYVVADPETRHNIQTACLDTMFRSCVATERIFSSGSENPDEIPGTIYSIADVPIIPRNVDGSDLKLVIWKRLLIQLEIIKAIIGSKIAKTVNAETLFGLLNRMLVPNRRDEHLLFLQPSLIQKSIEIVRELVKFDNKMVLKNHHFFAFFLRALEITLQSGVVDLGCLRPAVYDAMTDWFRSFPPTSLCTTKSETLLRIVKITCTDISNGEESPVLIEAALRLQRAIILAYGEADKEHVHQILMHLIPTTLELSRPFSKVFMANPKCRLRMYELLLTFCTAANATLMPPMPEIEARIVEGIQDEIYEVREVCKSFHKITLSLINPLQCGFRKSHSHALHEHNREVQRLQLTRQERTRAAETQTIDCSLYAPTKNDKIVMTDAIPEDEEEEMDDDYSEEDYSEEENSIKEVKSKKRCSDSTSFTRPNKVMRRSVGTNVTEDDDLNGCDDDENDDEEYESFRREESAVIIADDDDEDDEVVITPSEGMKRPFNEDEEEEEHCDDDELDEHEDEDDCIVYEEPTSTHRIDEEINEEQVKETEETFAPVNQNGTLPVVETSISVKQNGQPQVNGQCSSDAPRPSEEGTGDEEIESVSAAVIALGSDEEDVGDEFEEEPTGGLVVGTEKLEGIAAEAAESTNSAATPK